MLNNFLAFGAPDPIEILVILLVALVVWGIPVVLVVVFLRLLLRNKRENIRLRLDVGKLADELEQVRKQKSAGDGDTANDSS